MLAVTLQSLTATLGAAWLISCKKLGGLLFIALKVLEMLTWTMAPTGVLVTVPEY